MLESILYILFFVSCIILIVAILLQPGKADAGALFTSSVSSTAFGARGTQTVLSKATIGIAILYMISALLLSMNAIRGGNSVMQGSDNVSTQSSSSSVVVTDQTTANQNANTSAPAVVETNANVNN